MDPYWNLATEEHLLKSSPEDFIFLYINKSSVVVGKHQIAQKEINSQFINDNNILVARRLSGGGTVYHDEGNLNLSFIQTVKPGENISYKSITRSFYIFLKNQIPELVQTERNDFVVNGKKVSGSAMHISKNRILAHCTLLIDCNLVNLSSALKGHPERFTDKSISSKRSDVMNLSEITKSIYIGKFLTDFISYLKERKTDLITCVLNSNSDNLLKELVSAKYSTIPWIYGYSPKYIYQNSISYMNTKFYYSLEIENGIIEKVSLDSTHSLNDMVLSKFNGLRGKEHNPKLQLENKHTEEFSEIDGLIISSLL
jgi:lipoate-protein ligase A